MTVSDNQNICVAIIEASSSKTAIHFFNVSFDTDKSHHIIDAADDKYSIMSYKKIAQYANNGSADEYYNVIMENILRSRYMSDHQCQDLHTGLYASGGMRNSVSHDVQNNFYRNITMLFQNNKKSGVGVDVKLHQIKTLDSTEEGLFAWNSVAHLHDVSDHIVLDMGGATMQIAQGGVTTRVRGYDLGKEASIAKLSTDEVAPCIGKGGHYNGKMCRQVIKSLLLEILDNKTNDALQHVADNLQHFLNNDFNNIWDDVWYTLYEIQHSATTTMSNHKISMSFLVFIIFSPICAPYNKVCRLITKAIIFIKS